MSTALDRHACLALDRADALAPLREQFELPDGRIYLDGNSLGALPRSTADRVARAVREEWGHGLIESWNRAGWIALPQRVGDKIARLVGAAPGELVAADSTSVNLFKVLSAALALQAADAPQRRVIVSERSNFPTDLYIAETLAQERGLELRLVEPDEIALQLNGDLAVLMLTQVNYRSGQLHDMAALSAAAHAAGALTVWDLAHSAGALPVDLNGSDADFAVGCGYKYLNGGPGAPAFVWMHARHAARMDREGLRQPLSGWMGHAAPFEFTPGYRPAAGVQRYLCGTPAILALTALECGVDTLLAAEPLGGMATLRAKSVALCELFAALVESRCAGHGLTLASPRDATQRGSQVCFSHPEIGYAAVQALIARGVVGDFRAPDILRFGFTPLYTRFVDVWDAVEHLRQVLEAGEWRRPEFNRRNTVT
ncbi:kynureninase [uncultured Methylibium sp.]|uniref:kynureninase n=1 Tax=uncultured Methylibium sp. TaxID=381093 RepID=UPI0025FA9308|nr:kynureninase [uncultured Methylibium sp.]